MTSSDKAGRDARADMAVHILGVAAGTAAAVFLLTKVLLSPARGQVTPVAIYSAGLLAMLGCSAAYNVWRSCRWRVWLRRLDHAAIFVMIAGTYTPILALRLSSAWSTALLATVWLAAALGVALKLWKPHRIEAISIALYLVLGWIGLAAAGELVSKMASGTLVLLLAGGLVYSAGLVFHLSRGRRYQAALWHLSVLVAASLHYVAVLSLVEA
jgi:hemolysin III